MLHIIQVILFILPSYFANSLPVIFGGGLPIDMNYKFIDGKRILGEGKTWQGFFIGVGIAWLIGCLYAFILPGTEIDFYQNNLDYVLLGIISGFGTMIGDSLGSFIKRRMNLARGTPSFFIDQLLFLYASLLLIWIAELSIINLYDIIWLTILTYLVHRGANILANKFGWKNVPW